MSPRFIVRTALEKRLDIIAITDHNSAENVHAVLTAAEGSPLTVVPGMEIASREEVHILTLYPDIDAAWRMQEIIYSDLKRSDDESFVEEQVIANEHDEVEGFCPYILVGATSFGVKKIVELVHECSGLALAAHIDRQAFGIIGQLGFIPPRVPLDGLEVSPHVPLAEARRRFPEYAKYPFITNSDAHFLNDVGKAHTTFFLQEPSFKGILDALRDQNGCSICEGGAP